MQKTSIIVENRLTDQQRKWFDSIQQGLERETGRSLAAWVEIAKTCPAAGHRARLKWFKDHHNLLQNRASYVLSAAFPPIMGWSEPESLQHALWQDPSAKAIFLAVRATVERLPDIVAGQRKGFSAWSRKFQFVAIKPKAAGAVLGLALPPDGDRLKPAKNEGWSERLKSCLLLHDAGEVDHTVAALIERASHT